MSSGLLALKTKHNEHNEMCISQDSWLQATATNPIYEARRGVHSKFFRGFAEYTGSCGVRLEEWAGMCGGGAGRGFGASQLELFFGKELTSVFATLFQVTALVASIMGVREGGWQWEKEYAYQKGPLVVNRVQIHTKV